MKIFDWISYRWYSYIKGEIVITVDVLVLNKAKNLIYHNQHNYL